MARWHIRTQQNPGDTAQTRYTGIHVVYQVGQNPKDALRQALEDGAHVQNPEHEDGLEIFMPCGTRHAWNTLRAIPLAGKTCECGSSLHKVIVFEEIRMQPRARTRDWRRELLQDPVGHRNPAYQGPTPNQGVDTIRATGVDETLRPTGIDVPLPVELQRFYHQGERYPVHFDRIQMPTHTQPQGTIGQQIVTAVQRYTGMPADDVSRRLIWNDVYRILRENRADHATHVWACRHVEAVVGPEGAGVAQGPIVPHTETTGGWTYYDEGGVAMGNPHAVTRAATPLITIRAFDGQPLGRAPEGPLMTQEQADQAVEEIAGMLTDRGTMHELGNVATYTRVIGVDLAGVATTQEPEERE